MSPQTPDETDRHSIASKISSHDFSETVRRLLSVFADHAVKVFAVIDQQAEAASAGLKMPPMTLIVFGNPKAGTPLMLARPESGFDLPLKVLVFESAGQVQVAFNTPDYIIARHLLSPALASNLAPPGKLIEAALQP